MKPEDNIATGLTYTKLMHAEKMLRRSRKWYWQLWWTIKSWWTK